MVAPVVIGGALAAGGSILSSAFGASQASKNRRFQDRLSRTAHQREVADLKAAGLNPILSAGGSGASTPSGAMSTASNPLEGLATTALAATRQKEEIKQIQATVKRTDAETNFTNTKNKAMGGVSEIGDIVGDTVSSARNLATSKKQQATTNLKILREKITGTTDKTIGHRFKQHKSKVPHPNKRKRQKKALLMKFKDKRKKVTLKFKLPSLTKQAFKDETNVNKIMARYQKTGELPAVNNKAAIYGDFSNVINYQDAFNQINEANKMFNSLPSEIRSEFNNDPEIFLNFASNPENLEVLQEMGLAPSKIPVQENKKKEATQLSKDEEKAVGDKTNVLDDKK